MRTVLVFPPQASPTYVPLGIALLAAHVRQVCGPGHVTCRDLNIATWEELSRQVCGGEELLRFLRGQEGDFYDEAEYRGSMASWPEFARAMARLQQEARRYVETGELGGPLAALLDAQLGVLLAEQPDRVGISVLYPQQLIYGLAVARRLADEPFGPWGLPAAGGDGAAPRLRILLGGAALSTLDVAELLRACPWVDGAVLGEGEEALAALSQEPWPCTVPGLWLRGEGSAAAGVVRHAPARALSLDDLPPPDFGHFALDRYFCPSPVLPMVSSRGCRWRRCRFCAHNFSFGEYRHKVADAFVDELEEQQRRWGVRHFYFADQYVDAADLRTIAEAIQRRGLDLHFHVMGRPTRDHDELLLHELARAGCRWISWGVETGSQRLLDVAGKGTSAVEIGRVLERTTAAGISNLSMMLFGLPTSTDEDLEQTFELLEGHYDHIEAMTASSFVLYDGTPFARRPTHYGLEVTGREVLFTAGGVPVHSHRLLYKERRADGSLRPPRGSLEVARWEQRRRWLGEGSILEDVWAEHYLLFVSHRHDKLRGPEWARTTSAAS